MTKSIQIELANGVALRKSRDVERLIPLTPGVIGMKQYRRVNRGHF